MRPSDGQVLTQTAASRNTVGFQALLDAVDRENPDGDLYLIVDNLSSHTSAPIREWLALHPRIHIETIPKGACRLNLSEGRWRVFRRHAFAGQSFADHTEIETVTVLVADQLNRRAVGLGASTTAA